MASPPFAGLRAADGLDPATSSYVLVTTARDEAPTIQTTIDSVVAQSCRPRQWVIVDDGSTDGTTEIVVAAAHEHKWITLVSPPGLRARSFAQVARNMEAAVRMLQTSPYRFLGILDADLQFETTYFQRVLDRFHQNPRLGLAGGRVVDPGERDRAEPHNRQDVPGAVQFFRRACLEKLGGFLPIPEGGWDCLTCVMARMAGYETELLASLVVAHLKPRNAARGGALRRAWDFGRRDYALGYAADFELVKCMSRLTHEPWGVGSLAMAAGYGVAACRNRRRLVPPAVISYLRHEQRARIKAAFRKPRLVAVSGPPR